MNFIKWGLDSIEEQLSSHTDEKIKIGLPDVSKFPLYATCVEAKSNLDPARVNVQHDHWLFVTNTKELEKTGLKIQSGIQIYREETKESYVVVQGPRGTHYPNDTNNIRTVIVTRLKPC